ncbi:metallophosphoesterase [Streptomyces litchfieldiae]|uniref:Metallophosphoesterase n=1 Tax=Streptomyces litchfieldiae TaxID=3075543 RepID=A0ABU2N047_9ACTN|nr:metallophosphoesterase [Streptomyces sp. DSM 44938]MDT0347250.1 metallophosphoesterase [Streptomyces sp. DSM 44938]
MIIGAALVLALLLGGIHWYFWKRLVRDVSRPGGWYRRVATGALVVLPLLSLLSLIGREIGIPFEVLEVIAWPGYYWFAAILYLILTLVVSEAVRFVLLRRLGGRAPAGDAGRVAVPAKAGAQDAGGAGPDPEPAAGSKAEAESPSEAEAGTQPDAGQGNGDGAADPTRRLVVARGIAAGVGVVTAGVLGYGSYAARNLTTKHLTIPLAKLPRAGHGYRIAVVSDIHLGPVMGRGHCQRVVDAINRTQPDLITVVGDLVDAEVEDLRSAAAPLVQLRSRDGAYFVTGNHEYMVDTRAWVDHVRELGLVPLENAREELAHFDLAGVNDEDGEGTDFGGPDYEAALGDRDPQRATVLMAHQPVQIHEAVDYGVDLQVSGHTHGGQMWPMTYIAGLANPTLAGLERYGDTQLYVSRGAGAWGPPVRVGADPDITVIELASGQA